MPTPTAGLPLDNDILNKEVVSFIALVAGSRMSSLKAIEMSMLCRAFD